MSAAKRGAIVAVAGVLGWVVLSALAFPHDAAATVPSGAAMAAMVIVPVVILAEAAAHFVQPHRTKASAVAAITAGLIAGLALDPFTLSDRYEVAMLARGLCALGLPLLWWHFLPVPSAPAEQFQEEAING